MVATPIGNLGDITVRARQVLRQVTTVVAEDTRRSKKLLAAVESDARLESFHAHSGSRKLQRVIELHDEGDVAYLTDAGTPGIADPGAKLVAAGRLKGHTISPVPGPSALAAALSVSGIESGGAVFLGFLPRRRVRRLHALECASATDLPAVVFCSPSTVIRTLGECSLYFGDDAPVVICRELTKRYEQVVESTLLTAPGLDVVQVQRGEYVLVVGQRRMVAEVISDDSLAHEMELAKAVGMSIRDASAAVADRFGVTRRRVYKLGLELRDKN